MEQEVMVKLTELLAQFQVEPGQVSGDATFEALGLDSLDVVELSVKIEDAYGIDIEESDLKDVQTVGDAVRVVVGKAGARA
ncbi:MAG TPA: phosphopantetheine-binding protein [Actinomycetota bacterium]|nr:phosphopantetheine-binding protein [Actinomycetota bacterium]